MKAMILAAGRGERMRPLTDTTPKPLLDVGGISLIGLHLRRLAMAGVHDVVINHAWLGEQIESALGDGSAYGVRIQYSPEPAGGLETAGGIAKALPLLGDVPFMVINGDIFTDYPIESLLERLPALGSVQQGGAHLVLVPKPDYKTGFDLTLDAQGRVMPHQDGLAPMTFCGIAAYHPAFLAEAPADRPGALLPWFLKGMEAGAITGELYKGRWLDVGTMERLALAREWLVARR